MVVGAGKRTPWGEKIKRKNIGMRNIPDTLIL